MERLQSVTQRPIRLWIPVVAVTLTVVLLSFLGVTDEIDRWFYERMGVPPSFFETTAESGTATLGLGIPELQSPFPHTVSALTFMLIAFAAFTAVWFTQRFRPVVALGFVVTFVVSSALLLALFLTAGWTGRLSIVPLALVLGYGIVEAEAAVHARRRTRFVQQLFSRHVPSHLAEAIWRRREQFLPGGPLHSQKLMATILFADMRGFTARAKILDAKVMMEWTTDYVESMARLIVEHGGVVDEYFGDALKANFGVPFARASSPEVARDASQAAACALAMGETLQGLNRRWQDRGFPMIEMRVGVATGEVVAACIGRTQPFKFTTMGDEVHLAAQLERFPPEPDDLTLGPGSCRILIAPGTATHLSERFWLHPIRTADQVEAGQSPAVYRIYGKSDRRRLNTGADQRSAFRVEMMTPVTLTHGTQAAGLTSNISVGGMAVCRFGQPLPIGTTAMLRFEVPGHPEPIRATGTVIWTHQDRAGIAFAELSPSDRVTLESFLIRQAVKKTP
jgi:adenylate cyclase